MSIYCVICGRELIKTAGPIGPTCARKMQLKRIRRPSFGNIQYIDMFLEEENNNGQRTDDETSQNLTG